MKYYLLLIGILLAFFAAGYATRHYLVKPEPVKSLTELVLGNEHRQLVVGAENRVIASHEYRGNVTFGKLDKPVKPETKEPVVQAMVTDTVTKSDSNYTLSVIVKHRDSVSVDWILNLKSQTITRVDTLFISRVDTLHEIQFLPESRAFTERPEFLYPTAALLSVITYIILK